jgi:DNA-binding CsgD family transcriptional regulator
MTDRVQAAYLMAEGLSDPEVARALKTDRQRAQLLMSGVLKKLNLSSRGELAALLGVPRDSSPATA